MQKWAWGSEPSQGAGRRASAAPRAHASHRVVMLLKLECTLASPEGLVKAQLLEPAVSEPSV